MIRAKWTASHVEDLEGDLIPVEVIEGNLGGDFHDFGVGVDLGMWGLNSSSATAPWMWVLRFGPVCC